MVHYRFNKTSFDEQICI